MDDIDVRARALDLAIKFVGDHPSTVENVRSIAEKFYNFLTQAPDEETVNE